MNAMFTEGVTGLTVEQLADLADVLGVDGPAVGVITFAAEVQAAQVRALTETDRLRTLSRAATGN